MLYLPEGGSGMLETALNLTFPAHSKVIVVSFGESVFL